MSRRRRDGRAEPTDDWEQLELLSRWPEQVRYELIRPIVLFDLPPAARARETGAAFERTLQRRAALWLHEKTLTLEHRGLPLSRYDVEYLPGAEGKKLAAVARPRLFESPYWLPQPRLFDLSSTDWLRALRLDGYAPQSPRGPQEALQGVLFPYLDAL